MTRNQRWLALLLTGSLVVVSPLLYAALADRLTPEYVPPAQREWVVRPGESLP
ncbi:MAG: hypothetical protein PHZ19_05490 [Candidatus Thermoplasmatota archaeon]|nr:hypothetical protein [Candidatus Thermoplasmatota archaeon]